MKLFSSKNLLVILFSLLVLVLVVVITLNYSAGIVSNEKSKGNPILLSFSSSFSKDVILEKSNLRPYNGVCVYKKKYEGKILEKRIKFNQGVKREVIDLNEKRDTIDYNRYDGNGVNLINIHKNDTLSKVVPLNAADSLVVFEFINDLKAKKIAGTNNIGTFYNCLTTVFKDEIDSFKLVNTIKDLSKYKKNEVRIDLSYTLRGFIEKDSVDISFKILNSQKESEKIIGLKFIAKDKSFIKAFYAKHSTNDSSVKSIKGLGFDNKSFQEKFIAILPKDVADYEMTYLGVMTVTEFSGVDFIEAVTFRNGILLFTVYLFYSIENGVCILNSASIVKPSVFKPLWILWN